MFRISVADRAYEAHRPNGCTVLQIEYQCWPGNRFGLWLPETLYLDYRSQDPFPAETARVTWCNWMGDSHQQWEHSGQRWEWTRELSELSLTSSLQPDPEDACLWYRHTITNRSTTPLQGINTQTCFHLVDAPYFISIDGERIWACLDGKWQTTDRVPRDRSPDPRRVVFLRSGLRTARTVVPHTVFPQALMPQAATHPLLIAESYDHRATVGIAARSFQKLFNNNDPVLRCLHSDPAPIPLLPPGETRTQDGVIIFAEGDHQAAVLQYQSLAARHWDSASPIQTP